MLACKGYLQQLFHVLAYLKQYDQLTMVFDDTEPSYDPECRIGQSITPMQRKKFSAGSIQ
jgi:hypothetical protein